MPQKAIKRNRQQWGILDNDRGIGENKWRKRNEGRKRRNIDSVIRERVPANIRASSRGNTEGASVIHKKKVSKGWKV